MTHPQHGRDLQAAIAPLVGAYLDISCAPSAHGMSDVAVAVASACTLPRLRALAAAVRDPLPWRVFFLPLVLLPPGARSAESDAAMRRLGALAAELLRENGLGILRPEDVILGAGPLERAVSSMRPLEPN